MIDVLKTSACLTALRSLIAGGMLAVFCLSPRLYAAPPSETGRESGSYSGTDMMLVVDLSGSMGRTSWRDRFDPLFQWVSATLESDDRIGVVGMGYGARLLSPMVPVADFSANAIGDELRVRHKYTDVAAGLEHAYYELKHNSRAHHHRLLVLFSDAMIDLPRGVWPERNSKRYLLESLIPSIGEANIRVLAIVPEGRSGDYVLLEELTSRVGGGYFRGIPDVDDAFGRQYLLGTRTADVGKKVSTVPAQPKPQEAAEGRTSHMTADAVDTALGTKGNADAHVTGNRDAAPVETASTAAHVSSSTPSSASRSRALSVAGIAGGVLLLLVGGGWGIRHHSRRRLLEEAEALEEPEDEDADASPGEMRVMDEQIVGDVEAVHESSTDRSEELSEVLDEVRALKELTTKQVDPRVAVDDDDEPDFGEPKEELSVSLVSGFLDYAELSSGDSRYTDQISSRPAFSDVSDNEGDGLSLSNMETLIGTAVPDLGKKDGVE